MISPVISNVKRYHQQRLVVLVLLGCIILFMMVSVFVLHWTMSSQEYNRRGVFHDIPGGLTVKSAISKENILDFDYDPVASEDEYVMSQLTHTLGWQGQWPIGNGRLVCYRCINSC